MTGDETGSEIEGEEADRGDQFFADAHWARYLLIALIAVTAAGTIGQATWQMVQSTERVSGEFVELAETLSSNSSAIYNLVLYNEQGELSFVRLRNNGRILNFLVTHEGNGALRVVIELRKGVAQSLNLLDENNLTIRESKVSSPLQLLIGLVLLVVLALHLWPV